MTTTNRAHIDEVPTGDDVLTPEQRAALETNKAQSPICPYCEADPIVIGLKGPFRIGPVMCVCFFCQACRKTITMQMLGPAAPAQNNKSRLHLPGR